MLMYVRWVCNKVTRRKMYLRMISNTDFAH